MRDLNDCDPVLRDLRFNTYVPLVLSMALALLSSVPLPALALRSFVPLLALAPGPARPPLAKHSYASDHVFPFPLWPLSQHAQLLGLGLGLGLALPRLLLAHLPLVQHSY